MKRCVVWMALAFLMGGCAKKSVKPQITGWESFHDPFLMVGFKYPQGWQFTQDNMRFIAYSSPEVIERFYDYSLKGKDGGRLIVSFEKMDTLKSLDVHVEALKNDLASAGFDILEVVPKTIANQQAMQIHYSGYVSTDSKLEAIQCLAVKDSFLCSVKFEAFNKFFPAYQCVYDTALATLHLPVSRAKMTPEDLAKPSAEFKTEETPFFKISIPANFEASKPPVKAPVEFSLNIKGYREDSNIWIDVMPAKGLSLEKVVEQNAKYYKETSRGEVTIGQEKAIYLNYSPRQGIQSRVYFLVKNDKIYRIVFNYFAEMKADFLPAFEKSVNSILVK